MGCAGDLGKASGRWPSVSTQPNFRKRFAEKYNVIIKQKIVFCVPGLRYDKGASLRDWTASLGVAGQGYWDRLGPTWTEERQSTFNANCQSLRIL